MTEKYPNKYKIGRREIILILAEQLMINSSACWIVRTKQDLRFALLLVNNDLICISKNPLPINN
ncbi:hypothetical protein NIES4101_72150 [Calothrix sp. NIES-4101]|nr:hypothetical protein NIES4101_72150 [Calothrix sp. NIES-4101]